MTIDIFKVLIMRVNVLLRMSIRCYKGANLSSTTPVLLVLGIESMDS